MRCPRCGTENPEGKILCRACGTRLRAAAAAARSTVLPVRETDVELRRRVSFDLTRVLWVVIAVIIVGLGLGVLVK